MFRARRRSLWCCQQRSFDIGWPGGGGRDVVRLIRIEKQTMRSVPKVGISPSTPLSLFKAISLFWKRSDPPRLVEKKSQDPNKSSDPVWWFSWEGSVKLKTLHPRQYEPWKRCQTWWFGDDHFEQLRQKIGVDLGPGSQGIITIDAIKSRNFDNLRA